MDSHIELLTKFDSRELTAQSLVDWAIEQIGNDKNSESLNELAWLDHPDRSKARELFISAIEELNYYLPSYSERKLLLAKHVAIKMIAGEKDLNEGCSELSEISKSLNSPGSLSVFELLAHEQYDHKNIGINSENIKPSILKEANRLANEI